MARVRCLAWLFGRFRLAGSGSRPGAPCGVGSRFFHVRFFRRSGGFSDLSLRIGPFEKVALAALEVALLPCGREAFALQPIGDEGFGASGFFESSGGDEMREIAGFGQRRRRFGRIDAFDGEVVFAFGQIVAGMRDADAHEAAAVPWV